MRNDRNEVLEGTLSSLMAGLREARYQDETVNEQRLIYFFAAREAKN